MAEEKQKKPPRFLYAVLQILLSGFLIVAAFITAKFEETFVQMEMRELPLPTEGFLALCSFVRMPVGWTFVVLVTLVLVILARRGTLDPVLRKLVKLYLVLVVLLPGFWVLSIFMPIIKIQQALQK